MKSLFMCPMSRNVGKWRKVVDEGRDKVIFLVIFERICQERRSWYGKSGP